MDLRTLIKAYLVEAKMMQLATSVADQPWVCNVWFASDDKLNIYYFSATNRRHSQELKTNAKVAGAIVLPQTPQDKPRGLQFQGLVKELVSEEEQQAALAVYQDRIFDAKTINEFMQNTEKPHRFYQITPSLFVLFDTVYFPENPRQELHLP